MLSSHFDERCLDYEGGAKIDRLRTEKKQNPERFPGAPSRSAVNAHPAPALSRAGPL